ncbi:MAG: LamG domain-containing protein, partial [Verrucomicrobiales bacterium]
MRLPTIRWQPRCSPKLIAGILLASILVSSQGQEAVAIWNFENGLDGLAPVGAVTGVPGPDRRVSGTLPETNRAVRFSGNGDHLRVADSAELRFDHGDEITIECWLRCDSRGANSYIIGKGRLSTSQENQNWALRLMKVGGSYRVSFLFRSRQDGEQREAFHRWNSDAGISTGPLWHHVAVSYRFGDPGSIKAFVDGEKTGGRWDLGGATTRPPVVDDAEIWIGSSRGGDPGNSWRGAIDSLAIYRAILPDEVLESRVEFGEALP